MGRNKISISVAGFEFVVTTEEEREYTLALAQTVDSKIRGILKGNDKLSVSMAAILSCVDLCDENEKNKASCARLRDEIRLYFEQLEALKGMGVDEARLAHLEQENEELRLQLQQYQAGQIGFEQ